MLLLADKELASQLVHNLPRRLLNLVLRLWVQKVAGVGKSVGAQWTQLGKLELRAPDFCNKFSLHNQHLGVISTHPECNLVSVHPP